MSKVMRYLICLLMVAVIIMPVIPVSAEDSPDLVAGNIGVTTLYAGVVNKVAVTVNNATNVAVPSFDVKLQVNGNDIDTVSDNYLSGNQDPYYWPATVNFEWTPPATGNYTITAIIDPENTVTELNETNNTVQKTVDVIALAPVTVKVRVEGQSATIWNGEVTFQSSSITYQQDTQVIDHPTALGALNEAATAGSFSYVFDGGWWPTPFVIGIAGEANSGLDGWQYRVNWISPDVGASDYSVKGGDEVLWYYGGYDPNTWAPTSPLKLTVDKYQLTTSQTLTATVEAFDGISWAVVSGATMHIGEQEYTTDAEGQLKDLSLGAGSYPLYASKGTWSEYVRSNRETVTVSEASAGVMVSINAPASMPEGSDCTATVDISQVENFDACNYQVSFDKTVLRLDDVTAGSIDSTAIPVDFWNEEPVGSGTYTVVQNIPDVTGVTGSGYLSVLHFHVIGSAGDNSVINLSGGILSDTNAANIEASWNGAQVEIMTIQPGDANGDGIIDAADITIVERIIAGLDAVSPGADANQDGEINALDITKVERIFARLD